jgi:hypothetical protein
MISLDAISLYIKHDYDDGRDFFFRYIAKEEQKKNVAPKNK